MNAPDRRTAATATATAADGQLFILGVRIANLSTSEALELGLRAVRGSRRRTIFFANAHTLNLAWEDPAYRRTLNGAYRVFGDGTGVRWAARLHGVTLKDNLVGTDFVPALLASAAGRGHRYYLVGSTQQTVVRTAESCRRLFPGWELAGLHHGHFDETSSGQVIASINAARPHLVLVAMGNPLQERWIHDHRQDIDAALCLGVGGLFDHWAGNLSRAPSWVRRAGLEWLQILLQQPHKWRRYLLGNPAFLTRVLRSSRADAVRTAESA